MDTPAPSKERESNGFKIQRSNLRKIAELKQKLKALEKTTSTNTDKSTNKERESTSTTKNKNTTTDTTTTTKNKDDTKKKNPYEKRKPLNEKEKSLLATSGTKATAIFQDETLSSKNLHESTTNKERHRMTASRADGCGCG